MDFKTFPHFLSSFPSATLNAAANYKKKKILDFVTEKSQKPKQASLLKVKSSK